MTGSDFGAKGSCQCLLIILVTGSAGFNSAFGGSIAIGVTVVLVSARSIFKTSSLSDFINGCSDFISVGVTSSETFALARDAVPILTAAIAPRLIKQMTASQTVLIIQFLGIRRLGIAVWQHAQQRDRPKAVARSFKSRYGFLLG